MPSQQPKHRQRNEAQPLQFKILYSLDVEQVGRPLAALFGIQQPAFDRILSTGSSSCAVKTFHACHQNQKTRAYLASKATGGVLLYPIQDALCLQTFFPIGHVPPRTRPRSLSGRQRCRHALLISRIEMAFFQSALARNALTLFTTQVPNARKTHAKELKDWSLRPRLNGRPFIGSALRLIPIRPTQSSYSLLHPVALM
jgi:hypothetical protein